MKITWHRFYDCFICTSHRAGKYGRVQLRRNGRLVSLSRLICQRRYPNMGDLEATHTCGNALCIRPDHIVPATHKQNMQDMVRHGVASNGLLGPKGITHGCAKLNDDQVRAIRASTSRQRELVEKYNVSQSTISLIMQNKTWRHLL